MRPVRHSLTLCGYIALALSLAPSADAKSLCVNNGGSNGCYSTIQAAVSAAANHDTIQVAAGTYKESVTVNKSLSLIGAGAGQTIIDLTNFPNGILLDG